MVASMPREMGWQSGVRSCIMSGLPMAQSFNAGIKCWHCILTSLLLSVVVELILTSMLFSIVVDLLKGFFGFYSEFEFSSKAVCPRTGQAVELSELMKSPDTRVHTFKVIPLSLIFTNYKNGMMIIIITRVGNRLQFHDR